MENVFGSILLAGCLAAQTQMTVAKAPVQSGEPQELPQVAFDADPDVVLRGRTTAVVITGRDLAALKTVSIDPAAGVTVGAITVLPPRADGLQAVSVSLTVDLAAEPGEREITAVILPVQSASNAPRSAEDPMTKQMEQAFKQIAKKNETKAQTVGTLYVNSHDVAITQIVLTGSGPVRKVQIVTADAAGDIEVASGDTRAAALSFLSEPPVTVEIRCGADVFDADLDELTLQKGNGTAVVILADVILPTGAAGACDARARVRDKAGNVSPWHSARVQIQ